MGVHAGNHRGKPEWGYRYQITPKARPLFFCARNCMTGQISFKSNFFSPLLYLFPYILSLRVYYAYFNFILLEENSMPLSQQEYSSESDAVKGEMGGFLKGPAKVVILLRARSTKHGDQNGNRGIMSHIISCWAAVHERLSYRARMIRTLGGLITSLIRLSKYFASKALILLTDNENWLCSSASVWRSTVSVLQGWSKKLLLDHVTKRIYTQQQKMKMYHLPGYNLLSW